MLRCGRGTVTFFCRKLVKSMIDWGEALRVAITGFVGVFIILTVVFIITKAVGTLSGKIVKSVATKKKQGI